MEFVLAGVGLVVLVVAGEALVRGAVNLSLRLGIPALIVGLTIVAFGTSAPELLVSVQAVLEDVPGIAIGNVVGSNIANILLVLGLPAMMFGMNTSRCNSRESYAQMVAVSVLFLGLAVFGVLTWVAGLLLLAIYAGILMNEVRNARAHRAEYGEVALEGADPHMAWWKILAFLGVGLVGANILVDSATSIARSFGISETVIGLTLVAVGTSLPELATTLVAAMRRHADVALGNVLGSNIANILAILGISSLFGSIPIPDEIRQFDMWVMLVVALLILPFAYFRKDISRLAGAVLTLGYVSYVVVLLI